MTGDRGPEHLNGYLLLADISGFDAYLVDVELEHAHDIMAELLELIAASLKSSLRIAGIQVDAVLAYESADSLTRGETLLELAEATYVAFRDRLKSIVRNNTCGCRACAAVPTLDLKFLVHFGAFTVQRVANEQVTLHGLDANLVGERLLKDQVGTGARSYILFTEPCLRQMGVLPAGMKESAGAYPHLGEIRSSSLDLGERYEALRTDARTVVTEETADLTLTVDYAAGPSLVWDWLNDPFKRTRWLRWTTWRAGLRPGGRTGVGAVNHCAHGVGSVIETILDWRPYDYFTVEMAQDSAYLTIVATYRLEPLPEGRTRLALDARFSRAPALRLSGPLLRSVLALKLRQDLERMARLMAAE